MSVWPKWSPWDWTQRGLCHDGIGRHGVMVPVYVAALPGSVHSRRMVAREERAPVDSRGPALTFSVILLTRGTQTSRQVDDMGYSTDFLGHVEILGPTLRFFSAYPTGGPAAPR